MAEPHPFRCPAAKEGDDRDHILQRTLALDQASWPSDPSLNPFIRYRSLLHSYHHARSRGWSDQEFLELVTELDQSIASVDGTGFITPSPTTHTDIAPLSDKLVLHAKSEVAGVAGSHKARHLMGIALQLAVSIRSDPSRPAPRLAIASCGNAALGAAVLARALGWELTAFVPEDAETFILDRLRELSVQVQTCTRVAGQLGDPCMSAFQEAVVQGAIPFTVQGPQNGLCIEGGMTLGFELAEQGRGWLDHGASGLFVQVGGGALVSACVLALREAQVMGVLKARPRLYCVQTKALHPLERAWRRAATELAGRLRESSTSETPPTDGSADAELAQWLCDRRESELSRAFLRELALCRSAWMQPWPNPATSLASGILDDETYDWRVPVEEMLLTGGRPVIISEAQVSAATTMSARELGVAASPTGAAGLAGLLEWNTQAGTDSLEHATVLLTGGHS